MQLKDIYELNEFTNQIDELDIQVNKNVTLKVLKFEPLNNNNNPVIVFVGSLLLASLC